MTYDVAVPLIAVGLALLGVVGAKWLNRRLHRSDDEVHPAE